MLFKYNGVLHGLQFDTPFLKSTMVSFCFPRQVADQYTGRSISLEEALPSWNKYITTPHGINSAIIMLGNLTKATTVYRMPCRSQLEEQREDGKLDMLEDSIASADPNFRSLKGEKNIPPQAVCATPSPRRWWFVQQAARSSKQGAATTIHPWEF